MVEAELPEDVRRLILASVPTLDALELLIGLVRRAPAIMTPDMLDRELGASWVTAFKERYLTST